MHLYYNMDALVKKVGITSAGRPWSDPLNEFALSYAYNKGEAPFSDDLFARSAIVPVSPELTDQNIEKFLEIFVQATDSARANM